MLRLARRLALPEATRLRCPAAATNRRRSSGGALPAEADCVVVGGGVAGAAAAYHLARRGAGRVLLLERHALSAGTTWHSGAMLWRLRPSHQAVELHADSREQMLALEAAGHGEGLWRESGGLVVAETAERMRELRLMAGLGEWYGVERRLVTPGEVASEVYPGMRGEGLAGGLYVPSEGSADPTGLVHAYARGAKAAGAEVAEGVGVEGFERGPAGGVAAVLTECGRRVAAKRVVNAGGVWGGELAAAAGCAAPLPLRGFKHGLMVTEPVPELEGRRVPNVRHIDRSLYLKAEAGGALGIGVYEPLPAGCRPPKDFAFRLYDDDDLGAWAGHLAPAFELYPPAAAAGVKATVLGPEAFTPDHKPLVGPDPALNGVYHLCGFNSMGLMLAGGLARWLAEWLVAGAPPRGPQTPYDVARFAAAQCADAAGVAAAAHESYAKTYSVSYPGDEPLAGRGALRSPLHAGLVARGAVMQQRHGYERPAFFLPGPAPVPAWRAGEWPQPGSAYAAAVARECTRGGWPGSFAAVGRECRAVREGVGLIDASSYGKLELRGPGAAEAVGRLLSGRALRPPGPEGHAPVRYGLACSPSGGVLADLTGCLLAPDRAYLVGSAGGRGRDLRWARQVAAGPGVRVVDVTEERAVISVQGRRSLALVAGVSADGGARVEALPVRRAAPGVALVGGGEADVLRVSYVGELGYELHLARDEAARVYGLLAAGVSALAEAGVPAAEVGHLAVGALAAEKGYRHFEADVSPQETAAQAGLGWALRGSAPGCVGAGRAAARGETAYAAFRTAAPAPVSPGEPLRGEDGAAVGLVRAASFSHTLGVQLVAGYLRRGAAGGPLHVAPEGSARWALLPHQPVDPAGRRVAGEYAGGGEEG